MNTRKLLKDDHGNEDESSDRGSTISSVSYKDSDSSSTSEEDVDVVFLLMYRGHEENDMMKLVDTSLT